MTRNELLLISLIDALGLTTPKGVFQVIFDKNGGILQHDLPSVEKVEEGREENPNG